MSRSSSGIDTADRLQWLGSRKPIRSGSARNSSSRARVHSGTGRRGEQAAGKLAVDRDQDVQLLRPGIGNDVDRMLVDELGQRQHVAAQLVWDLTFRVEEFGLEDGPQPPVDADRRQNLAGVIALVAVLQPEGQPGQRPRFRRPRVARRRRRGIAPD